MILTQEACFLVITPPCVPDVFLTFLKIAPKFFNDTPVMSPSSQCRSGGMGVVLVVGEELGDDKENNPLFLMTWKLKRSTTGENSEPNTKKMWLGQLAPPACSNRTAQHKRDSGRRLLSMADSMMLMVVQVVVS
jgi:hypothetical protein